MTDQIQPANSNGHGGYEQRDIRTADVVYFLAALAFSGLIVYFVVTGVYHVLEKRNQEHQTPMSPLVKNVPEDTRHLPPEYKTDSSSTDYEKYLKANFPAPQLETDERIQLNSVITKQEEQLNSYGYIDEKAGTLHIPIERAMDLIAQRGLPVRGQTASAGVTAAAPAESGNTTKRRRKQ
jgi:hypothetical protein